MGLSWQQRLDAANTEAHVVEVSRDFIAQLRSDVLERLPADLRPKDFSNAAEVTAYAFSMVMHRVQGGGADIEEQVQLISTFFMSAATRLTQIMTAKLGQAPDAA